MDTTIENFTKSYRWLRNLSLKLLDSFSEEELELTLSDRSLKLRTQFIDLGITQLTVAYKTAGKDPRTLISNIPDTSNKEEIKLSLNECEQKMFDQINLFKGDERLDWFGRMNFDFSQSLDFIIFHESMHHGEVLSLIYAKNLKMPKAFKSTWGFELDS